MATIHPHLLFAKELSVLADIRHLNITESNPEYKGGERRGEHNKAPRGGLAGGGEMARKGERQCIELMPSKTC